MVARKSLGLHDRNGLNLGSEILGTLAEQLGMQLDMQEHKPPFWTCCDDESNLRGIPLQKNVAFCNRFAKRFRSVDQNPSLRKGERDTGKIRKGDRRHISAYCIDQDGNDERRHLRDKGRNQ